MNHIRIEIMFDCVKEFFQEVGPLAFFLDLHYKFPMRIISIGLDPINQTTSIGKFPIGMNPTIFL